MEIRERGATYQVSRISYISNYVLLILLIILFYFVYTRYNLQFTFFARSIDEFRDTMIVFGFLLAGTFLIEEPTIERILRHYIVTNNEIIKVEGLIRKKRISIPYQSVADVTVKQGVVGRIFNFGTIHVSGVGRGNDIDMKGMRDPDVVYRMIKNKIGLTRGAILKEGKKFQ